LSKAPDWSEQLAFFANTSPEPEGLRYATEFVSPGTEQELTARIAALPLQPFQFGQYEGKRRVASFGSRYDYMLRRLREAEPGLGAQHPRRRGAKIFNHVPDHDRAQALTWPEPA
jgi:hypothetical protein